MNVFAIAFGAVNPVIGEPNGITIRRRRAIVLSDGTQKIEIENEWTGIAATVVDGAVGDLRREPDYQTQGSTIEVVAAFPLIAQMPGYQADEVDWHGGTYIVTSVIDASKEGAGYVKATCSSIAQVEGVPMQP